MIGPWQCLYPGQPTVGFTSVIPETVPFSPVIEGWMF